MIDKYGDLLEIYDVNNFNISDLDILLHEVLKHIKNLLYVEFGVIYLKEDENLKFHVFQNDEMSYENIYRHFHLFKDSFIPLNLAEKCLIVDTFLSKKVSITNNIYNNTDYDFSDLKDFDKKYDYKSESVLVIPIINPNNDESIGVIQLVNKKFDDKIVDFDSKDEETVSIINSFVALSIVKALEEEFKLKLRKNTNYLLKDNLHLEHEKLIEHSHHMKTSEMRDVLSSLAHKWRQPLSSISTIASGLSLGLMEDNQISEEVVHNLRKIVITTQNLSSIIDDFRNLYIDLPKEKFLLFETFERVLFLYEVILNETGTKVITNIDKSIDLYGFKNQFVHILINLISNIQASFRFNDQSHKLVFVDIFKENDTLIIELKDNSTTSLKDKSEIDELDIFEVNLFIAGLILEKDFYGTLEKNSIEFEHDSKQYSGYVYKIVI